MIKPQPVSKLETAFGGDIEKLLPAWKEIPNEFKSDSHPWAREVSRIFFSGGSFKHWEPKQGVDKTVALGHFRAVICSFEPTHERKIAGLAYLLDQWFTLAEKEEKKETLP